MGAVDLDEVLGTVPGLHVGRGANVYSPLYIALPAPLLEERFLRDAPAEPTGGLQEVRARQL
jgi:hypothetical protein